MAENMINQIARLYTEGDLDGLRSYMLHSSAWIQHQHTAFGSDQITRMWMLWLANCGLSSCEERLVVTSRDESAVILSLKPENGQHEVRLAFWSWHNQQYFRRMVCQVDTALMRTSTGLEESSLLDLLPAPDPLVISDYDQQEHPHQVDVEPCELVNLDEKTRRALKGWWQLWQNEQLANVRRCYHEDARIQLPGIPGYAGHKDLLGFSSDWFLNLSRRFCQPESVIQDEEHAGRLAILWHMEGDMPGPSGITRVRVPVINLLEIDDGHITREVMITDTLAQKKSLQS